MQSVLSFVTGVGVVAVPALAVRYTARMNSRISYYSCAALAIAAISVCFYIAAEDALFGAIGFILALFGLPILRKLHKLRQPPVDFVVEDSLLPDAVSPELAIELEVLGEKFKRGEIPVAEHDKLAEGADKSIDVDAILRGEDGPVDLWSQ